MGAHNEACAKWGAASGALADAAAGVLAGAPLAGAEPQPPV